jgi:hypothetical protein
MNIFFKNKNKSPHELVKIVRDAIGRLNQSDRKVNIVNRIVASLC